MLLKISIGGQKDSSFGKGTCTKPEGPAFDPQYPYGERRKLTQQVSSDLHTQAMVLLSPCPESTD